MKTTNSALPNGTLFIAMRDVNVYLLQDVDALNLHHEESDSFIAKRDGHYARVNDASLKIDCDDVERAAFALLSRHSIEAMYLYVNEHEIYELSLDGMHVKATKITLK